MWCSVELEKALEKITESYESTKYGISLFGLFKDYIDTFLKIKQEASGYPKDRVTKEQKQQYVNEYFKVEGIQLDPNKIEHNPGLRALAKLMLNSFWGKYFELLCPLFVDMMLNVLFFP